MTSKKLSQLPGAAALTGVEILAGLQSGGDVGVTPAQIAAYMAPQIASAVAGSALININALASTKFVTDGVTSNVGAFQSLATVLQGICPEMPVPVNFTVGNPTVLSINPTVPSGGTLPNPAVHFLKPNQAFYFIVSAGGSLPPGVSLGTLYYITSANMTSTTFTFSAVNNYGPDVVEGATVTTTGSLTGTASIVLTGRDVNLFVPPGPYFGGAYGDPAANVELTPSGISRIRYHAEGAIFDTKVNFGVPLQIMADSKVWTQGVFDLVATTPNENNVPQLDAIVTLQTPANTANYYVTQWIAVFGVDIQDPLGSVTSRPSNNHYFEFKRIKSIGVGTLTLDGPLEWVYLSTFPNLFNATGSIGGGAALIAQMHPAWDTEVEIHGARWIGEPTETLARRVLFQDCVFQGYGDFPGQAVPTQAQSYIFRNCRFLQANIGSFMEIDKNIEVLVLDGCYMPNRYSITFPSTSVHLCIIKNHRGSGIFGSPRQIAVSESEVDAITVGPPLGVTDSYILKNSRVTYFDMSGRNDDAVSLTPTNDMTLVPNWSFSNGTFTRNITGLPGQQAMSWQIPGVKCYMTDAGNIFKFGQNMGSPFTILNVYMDGSGNFSFDTTLKAVPTRQTSSTVTITNASPGVVSWTSNGLANGTPVFLKTTGTLPSPLSPSTPYYVVSTATNTFQLALTVGGSAINTTTAGSGTHTAFGNPLCFRPHPCTRFTSIGNSGCNPIIDQNGSIDEPLFSRVKRAFVGKQSATNGIGLQVPNPRIWGFLRSMTVNVRQAGTASGTLTISSPGFTQPNLGLSNFSQVIDTTVAGARTWVGSAAPSGSAGSDSIAAYTDWIAGPLLFTWSTGVTLPNSPLVEFEMTTDQGITRFGNMMGMPAVPASGANLWQYIDSGIVQQFGTTP